MSDNKGLRDANKAKKDEFYTQYTDIEAELKNYKGQFAGKTVFCNCDDPYESEFFKYFAKSFNELKLKKLIATCYAGSPIAGTQLKIFDDGTPKIDRTKVPYKIIITEVPDANGDGAIDIVDVETLLQSDKNLLTHLNGDGDFRSAECIELLKEADIVCTNPPFSLFREFVAQLMKYEKQFLIIGNQNAITYKEIFPLIKDNKMWLGRSIHSGDREFMVSPGYELHSASKRIDESGNQFVRVVGVRWFTNLDYPDRHNDSFDLYKKYSPEKYPKYDNYDAINVDKTVDIPKDYNGVMGVPITFLDKYCPEQFEILGLDDHRVDWRGRGPDLNGKCKYRRIIIRKK